MSIPSNNETIAVCCWPYNRPHYIKPTIDSLLTNPESQTYPFYFFIDGDPNIDYKVQEVCNIVEQAPFNHKYIIKRNVQFGPCLNIIDSMRYLFDDLGYDRVIFFEDDMIMSPHYLCTITNLSNWAHKFDNIGYVIGHSICFMTPEEKKQHLNKVWTTFSFMCGWCMTKKVYHSIKDVLDHYEITFLRFSTPAGHCKYRTEIIEYMKTVVNDRRYITGSNILEIAKVDNTDFYKGWTNPTIWPSSQDFIIIASLAARGYHNLATAVNRILYIGKEGMHFREGIYNQVGFNKMTLDNFQEDRDIKEFEYIVQ